MRRASKLGLFMGVAMLAGCASIGQSAGATHEDVWSGILQDAKSLQSKIDAAAPVLIAAGTTGAQLVETATGYGPLVGITGQIGATIGKMVGQLTTVQAAAPNVPPGTPVIVSSNK